MITSMSNDSVRYAARLLKKKSFRQQEGAFVMEGLRSVREIPKDRLIKAYISESALKNAGQAAECAEVVSDAVMSSLSDTCTSQGFLAVVKKQEIKDLPEDDKGLYLLLEHIQDPGNLGTMIRMSEACGVTCLIMSSDTVDVYNPKVVRSTMGTILRTPFMYTDDLCGVIKKLRGNNIRVYAATLDNSTDYAQLDYILGCGFVIGNEANGLNRVTADACSGCVRIPMQGRAESLNAAVAASVLTFEAYRQKRLHI